MTDFEAARVEANRRVQEFEQLMDRVITDIHQRINDQQRTEQKD